MDLLNRIAVIVTPKRRFLEWINRLPDAGKPLSIDLPASVELTVTETDPSLKGATAAAQYKPAILETGLKVTVPPFIEKGEKIVVDTRDGKYLSRVK